MRKTAVFVPAYCLQRNGLFLTAMSEEATCIAAQLVKRNDADFIILSTAYDTWQTEETLKLRILANFKIDPHAIRFIRNVTDSYNEAVKTKVVLEKLNATRLIVIADKWHLPRALKAFRAFLPDDILVTGFRFTTPRYEMTFEPSRIKSIRAGYAPLWILWNIAFNILTPLIIHLQRKRMTVR